jgi:hypothetical protein
MFIQKHNHPLIQFPNSRGDLLISKLSGLLSPALSQNSPYLIHQRLQQAARWMQCHMAMVLMTSNDQRTVFYSSAVLVPDTKRRKK